MVKRWLLLGITAWLACAAQAAEVTVTPDRTTVFENESFNVDFSYDEEIRGRPNFDILADDFQIIAQSPSSRLQSINGRFSYELSWKLTLMPKRAGTLTIPAISFDSTVSEPLTITVKPALAGDAATELGDLSLEVTFTPDKGYVQGQFIYTQRLYHLGWLAGGKLSPPTFGASDAVVRQLDQVKRYSMFRDGERYQIYEQTYLVFPQRSGTLRADETAFTGELREPGIPPRLKRVSAPSISVEVAGVPDGIDSTQFLPASELTLEEVWPEVDALEVGRPYTRVIKMTAAGLMSSQLRAIEFAERDELRVYADQPQRDDDFAQSGVTGSVSQSVAIVPQRVGTMTLPAIEVRWWDVRNGVSRVASLPPRVVEVVAGSVVGGPDYKLSPTGLPVSPAAQAAQPVAVGWRYWPLLAIAFGLLWIGTLAAWGVSAWSAKPSAIVPSGRPDSRRKRALFSTRAALKKACDRRDPKAASAALLDWSYAVWPSNPPGGLQDIADRLGPDQAVQISRLAASHYGTGTPWENAEQLWQVLAQITPQAVGTDQRAEATLAHL
ncbi:MAG: BatD family protein [Gammaproteobacteria bacterium]